MESKYVAQLYKCCTVVGGTESQPPPQFTLLLDVVNGIYGMFWFLSIPHFLEEGSNPVTVWYKLTQNIISVSIIRNYFPLTMCNVLHPPVITADSSIFSMTLLKRISLRELDTKVLLKWPAVWNVSCFNIDVCKWYAHVFLTTGKGSPKISIG